MINGTQKCIWKSIYYLMWYNSISSIFFGIGWYIGRCLNLYSDNKTTQDISLSIEFSIHQKNFHPFRLNCISLWGLTYALGATQSVACLTCTEIRTVCVHTTLAAGGGVQTTFINICKIWKTVENLSFAKRYLIALDCKILIKWEELIFTY